MAVEIRQLVVKTTILPSGGDGSREPRESGDSKGADLLEQCRSLFQDMARQGRDR